MARFRTSREDDMIGRRSSDFFDTVPELLDPAQFYARFWVAPRHGPIQWGP